MNSSSDNINEVKQLKSISETIENFVRKEENAGYQNCLLFPLCFNLLYQSF